jgi:cysteine synthase A
MKDTGGGGMGLTTVIGNTPVVKLGRVVPEGAADVWVKLEWYNPTGSYKDRMALAIVEGAERRGDLRPGMTVVEYTGGSTGSSLAFVCAVKGYRFVAVSSDAFAEEKLKTMRAFGAEVEIIPSVGGVITPDLVPRMIERAQDLASQPGTFWSDQFHNHDAITGYRKAGEELLAQLPESPDVVCMSVGTAGFAMGTATAVRHSASETRIVVFEPASSAVISGAAAGKHHVEGIGVGFVPPLLDPGLFDEVRPVEESDGREMARRLAREEGLLAGISSGLNVAGAIQLAVERGPGRTVATVAVDTGLKYLAGDLFDL